MSTRTIQDQTIWISQPKRGAGKRATADDADLDVLTKVSCLYLLDQRESGFHRPLRTFRVLRGHVHRYLARCGFSSIFIRPARRKNNRTPEDDHNDHRSEMAVP